MCKGLEECIRKSIKGTIEREIRKGRYICMYGEVECFHWKQAVLKITRNFNHEGGFAFKNVGGGKKKESQFARELVGRRKNIKGMANGGGGPPIDNEPTKNMLPSVPPIGLQPRLDGASALVGRKLPRIHASKNPMKVQVAF